MKFNINASLDDNYSPSGRSQACCSLWLHSSVCALQLLLLDLPGQSAAANHRPTVTTHDSSVMLADDRQFRRWKRRCHGNCSLECPNYANKRPLSDEANGERPRLHSIILIEPEAWHENKPEIMLLMDGGDGPAATIYQTAILINSYPVTWALTGMNKLTW